MEHTLFENMSCFIGRTVTVFTTSGGLSGAGFTGVLISVDCNVIRLLCDQGAPPACPIGSACSGNMTPCGFINCSEYGRGYGFEGFGCGYNPLGSVVVIPICAIAAFSHHAI